MPGARCDLYRRDAGRARQCRRRDDRRRMAQASRQVAARRSRPAAWRTRPLGPAHSRRARVAPPRKGTGDVSDLKISWIGLGKLGLPMAARIAATGRAVMGYDLDAERAELA